MDEHPEDEPADVVVELRAAPTHGRGRYLLAAAAMLILVGRYLFLTGSDGDDNGATNFTTQGPIVGPNGEDLGIWADAVAGLSPQADVDRTREYEESIARSLPEINLCLVELMNAETEGFGCAGRFDDAHAYPSDVTACYEGRTIDGA